MHASSSLLHLVITVRPFAKWGIDFMTCNPHLARGHGYIIVAIDYFTKWVEAMPILTNDDNSTPYYPQSNGQFEAMSKILVTMLQRTIGMHRSNCHLMLFFTLWAYRTSVNDAIGFTPFHLVYDLEATLLIECEIPSLKLFIALLSNITPVEEHLLYLEQLDETRRLASLVIEA
eukprot:PITA_08178